MGNEDWERTMRRFSIFRRLPDDVRAAQLKDRENFLSDAEESGLASLTDPSTMLAAGKSTMSVAKLAREEN